MKKTSINIYALLTVDHKQTDKKTVLFDGLVYTMDWHPKDHISFISTISKIVKNMS